MCCTAQQVWSNSFYPAEHRWRVGATCQQSHQAKERKTEPDTSKPSQCGSYSPAVEFTSRPSKESGLIAKAVCCFHGGSTTVWINSIRPENSVPKPINGVFDDQIKLQSPAQAENVAAYITLRKHLWTFQAKSSSSSSGKLLQKRALARS